MGPLLHMGEALSLNAHLYPDRVAARDLARSMTFRQWNERSCRLANALLGSGLRRGDAIAILALNCVEWLEIYAATAKAGLVMVPINFRLVGSEIQYIVENSEAKALKFACYGLQDSGCNNDAGHVTRGTGRRCTGQYLVGAQVNRSHEEEAGRCHCDGENYFSSDFDHLPTEARAFILARCENAARPASILASFPPQAFKASACKARP